jgi:hypothetical protein
VPIAIIDGIFIANIIARARALELQREFGQLTCSSGQDPLDGRWSAGPCDGAGC